MLYRGDLEAEGVAEIFAGDVDGTPPKKLNPQLPSNADVTGFRIDPQGSAASFVVDGFDDAEHSAAFVTTLTGDPIQIASPGADALLPEWVGGGTSVVWLSDEGQPGLTSLWSAERNGAQVRNLVGEIPSGGGLLEAVPLTTSRAAVVKGRLSTPEHVGLYLVGLGVGQ